MKAAKKKRAPIERLHFSLMDELRASPVQPIYQPLLTDHLLVAFLGFDSLAGGGANQQECADVSDVLNVAAAMQELNLVTDEHGAIKAAKDALGAAFMETMGEAVKLHGDGLEALRGVLLGYCDVVAVMSARAFVASTRHAHRRVLQILKGSKDSGDTVIAI